jgi:hypothetical protein
MTAQELFDFGNILYDKTGSPWFNPSEFTQLFNMSYDIWIRLLWRRFEIDSENKYKIRVLLQPFEVVNSRTVIISNIVPNIRYEARIRVSTAAYPNGRSCRPFQNNRNDLLQTDPFNYGTDREPSFVQESTVANGTVFTISSDTVPTKIDGLCMRQPTYIDLVNAPTAVFEQPDDLAREIVSICARNEDEIIENFNRMQADEAVRIAPKMA